MECSTDQSWLQIVVVQPAFDGHLVLVPEVEVVVSETRSSLQPALQYSRVAYSLPHVGSVGGHSPLKSVTHGHCDARPTVTFLTIGHRCPATGTKLYCLVTEDDII